MDASVISGPHNAIFVEWLQSVIHGSGAMRAHENIVYMCVCKFFVNSTSRGLQIRFFLANATMKSIRQLSSFIKVSVASLHDRLFHTRLHILAKLHSEPHRLTRLNLEDYH